MLVLTAAGLCYDGGLGFLEYLANDKKVVSRFKKFSNLGLLHLISHSFSVLVNVFALTFVSRGVVKLLDKHFLKQYIF